MVHPLIRRALSAFAAAALVAVGLVGCGGDPAADRARPARLYPFASAVYYTPEEERVIHDALENRTVECMRERGFDYQPVGGGSADVEPDNPYALLDTRTAATHGYGIVPAEIQQRQRPAATDTPQTDPTYDRALVGSQDDLVTLSLPGGEQVSVAVGGCVTVARTKVFAADWDTLYYTFQSLSNQAIERTGKDPAVNAAVASWSACVAESGYRAATPGELREQLAQRARQATDDAAVREVARAELAAAGADAACQERARLREATEQAQAAAEAALLTAPLQQDLARLRHLKQAALTSSPPP
ncbi:hypothetical protein [Plantactinospora endophytica]|uniref:Lipoprotein n=1 Tax=Plantactinospora endophytica TaxID=673535 RepID=A0ABQ4DZT3_9ACTN|nr:hypothetical protein [Plantactinospora endophytica]GIG87989.1 hypothetical protein Pen02_29250 [Plantactinospora endophytica]